MSILLTAGIITGVGIASSFVTFKIWEAEAFQNYDRYDAHLRAANDRIAELKRENSRLHVVIAEQNIRLNPAQPDFFDIPSKKEYRVSKDLFGEF